MTNLRLSSPKLAKDLRYTSGLSASGQEGIELLRSRGNGNQLAAAMMHFRRRRETHRNELRCLEDQLVGFRFRNSLYRQECTLWSALCQRAAVTARPDIGNYVRVGDGLDGVVARLDDGLDVARTDAIPLRGVSNDLNSLLLWLIIPRAGLVG